MLLKLLEFCIRCITVLKDKGKVYSCDCAKDMGIDVVKSFLLKLILLILCFVIFPKHGECLLFVGAKIRDCVSIVSDCRRSRPNRLRRLYGRCWETWVHVFLDVDGESLFLNNKDPFLPVRGFVEDNRDCLCLSGGIVRG